MSSKRKQSGRIRPPKKPRMAYKDVMQRANAIKNQTPDPMLVPPAPPQSSAGGFIIDRGMLEAIGPSYGRKNTVQYEPGYGEWHTEPPTIKPQLPPAEPLYILPQKPAAAPAGAPAEAPVVPSVAVTAGGPPITLPLANAPIYSHAPRQAYVSVRGAMELPTGTGQHEIFEALLQTLKDEITSADSNKDGIITFYQAAEILKRAIHALYAAAYPPGDEKIYQDQALAVMLGATVTTDPGGTTREITSNTKIRALLVRDVHLLTYNQILKNGGSPFLDEDAAFDIKYVFKKLNADLVSGDKDNFGTVDNLITLKEGEDLIDKYTGAVFDRINHNFATQTKQYGTIPPFGSRESILAAAKLALRTDNPATSLPEVAQPYTTAPNSYVPALIPITTTPAAAPAAAPAPAPSIVPIKVQEQLTPPNPPAKNAPPPRYDHHDPVDYYDTANSVYFFKVWAVANPGSVNPRGSWVPNPMLHSLPPNDNVKVENLTVDQIRVLLDLWYRFLENNQDILSDTEIQFIERRTHELESRETQTAREVNSQIKERVQRLVNGSNLNTRDQLMGEICSLQGGKSTTHQEFTMLEAMRNQLIGQTQEDNKKGD